MAPSPIAAAHRLIDRAGRQPRQRDPAGWSPEGTAGAAAASPRAAL